MQITNTAMQRTAILILAVVSLLSVGATAQGTRSEVSVQGTGIFTKDSNGQGVLQQSTQTGGVLGTYRYRINHWFSAEAAYGWNRNSQLFSTPGGSARVQTDMHQVTGALVVNLPALQSFKNMHPYVLAGGGALIFDPTNNGGGVLGVQRQTVGTFVYGGGADFPIPKLDRLALRLEYRGLVYNAPNFGLSNLDTGKVTHTAVPSAGLVFRF